LSNASNGIVVRDARHITESDRRQQMSQMLDDVREEGRVLNKAAFYMQIYSLGLVVCIAPTLLEPATQTLDFARLILIARLVVIVVVAVVGICVGTVQPHSREEPKPCSRNEAWANASGRSSACPIWYRGAPCIVCVSAAVQSWLRTRASGCSATSHRVWFRQSRGR
jgi:hypothetical protein